jgi:hypothetical protein
VGPAVFIYEFPILLDSIAFARTFFGVAKGRPHLRFANHTGTLCSLKEVRNRPAAALPRTRGFPRMRKSHSAQQSMDVELARLRSMSIEDRVVEALSIKDLFVWLKPTGKDA